MTGTRSVTSLPPERLRFLRERLLDRQHAGRTEIGGSVRPAGPLPLSFAQERLWLLDRMEPGSAAYVLAALFRLDGLVAPAALAAALSAIVARHEVLRTVIAETVERPSQSVLAPAPALLPQVDLSALPALVGSAETERLATEQARLPFDCRRGPLLRHCLVRQGALRHALVLSAHHIIFDGASVGILVRELSALYAAALAHRPDPLPRLEVQFADFALWERKWLAGERLAAELAFWSGSLGNVDSLLELPLDGLRPAVRASRGGLVEASLDARPERVAEVARRTGATRFIVMLAAFQALLHRYSGQEDVRVGTAVANRDRRALEGSIGLFANTLVLRAEVSGNPTFAAFLSHVREVALAAYSHQDLPFEKLVAELAPRRDLSRQPLFQVFFLAAAPPAEADLAPGLGLSVAEVPSGAAKHDLKLVVSETGGTLRALVEHNADLFAPETARRLAGHFGELMSGALESPGTRISELPLLSREERRQVLADAAQPVPPPARSLTARFAEWAQRTPDALAVVGDGLSLSYRELADRARELASRLRALGVGPEVRVALCMERSPDLVAAILGTFQSGGAYVPLEPDLPEERLAFLLADSGARVVVTDTSRSGLAAAAGLPALAPTRPGCDAGDAGCRISALAPAEPEERLAYVIYTSGSTGRPKGVGVAHQQLAQYLDGVLERLLLPPGSSYAVVSTPAADLGHTVVFAALATGGTLHIPSRARCADPAAMAELGERFPFDCLKIVPSHLSALLTAVRPERVLPRRLLVLGGEAAPWSLIDRVRQLAPGCRILNHYGPTETTVGVLTWEVGAAATRRHASVPLGPPLPGMRLQVVDAGLQALPIGAPGELVVGGPQVARGYADRPELTAESFVPDAMAAVAGLGGERLYRTGDRVRRLPGGLIEILGRTDRQVKIRGFRVEPGEIELALQSHPAVRDAVVVVLRQGGNDLQLAACVVAHGEPAAGLAVELHTWLGERLPAAMVPPTIFFAVALPLNPNGKIDLREVAVQAVRQAAAHSPAGEDDVPRTPAEEIVVGLFAEMLGATQISVRDDFFLRGGDSLLAARLVSRLRRVFGGEVELRAVFEGRTPSALAACLSRQRRGGSPPSPPLTPRRRPIAGGESTIPLSFAQERLWVLAQRDPASPVYNVPRHLDLTGPFGRRERGALAAALNEIVRRHEALRTTFAVPGGHPAQNVLAFAPLSLPLVDLGALPQRDHRRESARLTREEARQPFDLTAGPLIRAQLLRLAESEHRLIFTLHHLVSDGWSTGVIVRELGPLYDAAVAGRPSPLSEPAVQYADYALWQRGRSRDEVLAAQLAWWRRRLTGCLFDLELPADRPRPAVPTSRGGFVLRRLPPPVSESLHRLRQRAGVTLHMTLLAAYQCLLCRTTGQQDLPVGTPVANRTCGEVESVVGFFVNMLVLRVDLAGDPPLPELLDRVRETALDAYDHQDLPFERLVEEMRPHRAGGAPLLQAALAFQTARRDDLRLSGLQVTAGEEHTGTAKFDLTLSIEASTGGLTAALEHADRFEATTANRLLSSFATLLSAIGDCPGHRLSELPLLEATEREQLLSAAGRNQDRSDHREMPIHELFSQQAAQDPWRLALIGSGWAMTYGQLDAEANRIAHRLLAGGLRTEAPVGVALERSSRMVAAFLGVLKAGGAYVPLDPAFPPARLAIQVEEIGVSLVISEQKLRGVLPAGLAVVCLDGESGPLAAHPGEAPGIFVSAANLACVLFTSGSSGRPKAVGIEHSAVVRLVCGADYADFGAEHVFFQLAPAAFDAATFEIWGPLLNGGRLAIPPPGTLSIEELAEQLADHRATSLLLTTALFVQVVALRSNALSGLSQLLFGGEVNPPAAVNRALAELPGCALVAAYGPTENTTLTTCHRLLAPVPPGATVPIGRPIAQTRVHVLDLYMQPVPDEVPGELFAGGNRLARGYLGRPDLTAERFLPSPFTGCGDPPGARLYRTGDRVRRRSGGDLEFVSRVDRQIKIRGFRVEPGEVEAALTAHPAVAAGTVFPCRAAGDEWRLVAYAVPRDARSLTDGTLATELRHTLAATLPHYMMPAAFVILPELPRTLHGKIDHRALPVPEERAEWDYLAPSGGLEELLAAIWSEVLEVETIGSRDDFFRLGGHSLRAVRMISRVHDELAVRLPLQAVFDTPTLAGLAERIAEDLARQAGAGLLDLMLAETELDWAGSHGEA